MTPDDVTKEVRKYKLQMWFKCLYRNSFSTVSYVQNMFSFTRGLYYLMVEKGRKSVMEYDYSICS